MKPAAAPPAPAASAPDAAAAARRAGLRWVSDGEPGIARVRRGAGFDYVGPDGRPVRDAHTLARIRALVIPPAWERVWVCAHPQGHLQATGRDARGRKQYRYHADWAADRGRTKFDALQRFGQALPRIRARVQRELARAAKGPPTREHVLATLVRLLDTTWLRIGNAEYARRNGSYGLSTLRNRHAGVRGDELQLSFVGKSGVRHTARLADPRVARVVRRCRELPGQELFQYVDAEGAVHRIDSADVNDWLRQAAAGGRGGHADDARITAKDFRTWHGSVQALELTLAACAEGAAPCRPQDVLAAVARRLGNTPAVCRKAYIHPCVLELGSALADAAARAALRGQPWAAQAVPARGLGAAERRLLALLRSRPRAGQAARAASAAGGKAGAAKAAGVGKAPRAARASGDGALPAAAAGPATARRAASGRGVVVPAARGRRAGAAAPAGG